MKQDEVRESFFKRMFAKGKGEEKRKMFTLVLCLSLVLVECLMNFGTDRKGSGNHAAAASDPASIKGYSTRNDGKWDLIEFGNYIQKSGTGASKEPIQWRVLSVSDNKAVLLSNKILDYHNFNNSDSAEVVWTNSGVRAWLNSSDGFLGNAFTSSEQEAIESAAIAASSAGKDAVSGDKVYLLSASEISDANGLISGNGRQAANTAYALEHKKTLMSNSTFTAGNDAWMLRTQGNDISDVSTGSAIKTVKYVPADGSTLVDTKYSTAGGIRPALLLNLTKEVWKYVGTVDGSGVVATPTATPSPTPTATPTPTPVPVTTPTYTYNPNAPIAVPTVNPSKIPSPSPKPTATPAPTKKPAGATPAPVVIKKGVVKKVGKIKYSILKSELTGGTVAVNKTRKMSYKKITIPDTVKIQGITYKVTEISKGAFTGMKKLKTLTIGNNVESIGESAFESCQKLEFVMIPKKVTAIEKRAFASCKRLHYFVIKSSKLSAIGSKAFFGTHSTIKIKTPKKKLKSYKTLFKANARLPKGAVFITSPKTIKYKGVNY